MHPQKVISVVFALTAGAFAAGCPASAEPPPNEPGPASASSQPSTQPGSQPSSTASKPDKGTALAPPPAPGLEVATFAGGCFWCMEGPFEKLPGVKSVVSGYTGGRERHPTYYQVGYGKTGHTEAVRVTYDPDYVTYEELLQVFWMNIDPTDSGGQFYDRGSQYRTGIFVHSDLQKTAAEASKAEIARSGPFKGPIVTPVLPAGDFWIAEDNHQDYYKKNPRRYYNYKVSSGREAFIKKHWGDKAL